MSFADLLSRTRHLLRRHIWFTVLVTIGFALRLLVLVTFRPALEFLQDSYDYLLNAQHLRPGVVRPLLYPALLRMAGLLGGVPLIPVLQHLAGLGMAALLYATLLRSGARRWLAAVGVAPLLLDAYQLDIEQFVLSETVFEALIVVSVACLLWRDCPSLVVAACAGTTTAAAVLTRDVGAVLIVGPIVLLLLRRVGWRVLTAFTVTAAVPLIAYAAWFASLHGPFGLQRYSGIMLASRAMTIADCSRTSVPAEERPLCVTQPRGQRQSSDWYASHPHSPLRRFVLQPGQNRDAVAGDFARRIIRAQPLDYAGLVGSDLSHYFAWSRSTGRTEDPIAHWQFADHRLPRAWFPLRQPKDPYTEALPPIGGAAPNQSTVASYGTHSERLHPTIWTTGQSWLAGYQRVAYTPGTLLAVGMVLGAVAGLGRLPVSLRRMRWDAVALSALGVALLSATSLAAVFQYRYVLPVLPLLPPAGALGLELMLRRHELAREGDHHRQPERSRGNAVAALLQPWRASGRATGPASRQKTTATKPAKAS